MSDRNGAGNATVLGENHEIRHDGIAIIGMSCLFPGAPNVDAYWRNILAKVNAITDPPPEAWDTDVYYDPDFIDKDKVYCKKGGYLGNLASFDPLPHGIPPFSVGGEPDQWLALQLARDAMADAGCTDLPEEIRQRTAVILGKGTYLNGGNALAVEHGLIIGQTLEIIKRLNPEFTGAQLELLRQEMKEVLPPIGPETVPGLIPNIIVGRIANRLDLMGPTYTVDAACASSLVAVHQAMRDLRNGECDLALVGGAQVWMPVPALNVFCQLGALSRRQQIRPFDKDADGTILGEGVGMVVLKRLTDAERDGDRIYAVIKGAGVASDGRGVSVMAPRVEGEVLALQRAYEAAGISPRSVGLIEAHGTATPVGDVVEVQALTRVFGQRDGELPTCAVGTVKSMISHTIPAAGVAGLIKTALALYHKVLPPTLNCDEPNPKLELEKTPFYINTETRPWIHGESTPRRAGVNAFGFGGINAHVILEEYSNHESVSPPARPSSGNHGTSPVLNHLPPWDSEVCILEGATRGDLVEQADRLVRFLDSAIPSENSAEPAFSLTDLAASLNQGLSQGNNTCRLALVATSLKDLRQKLDRAMKRLSDPGCRRIKDVSGIYFNAEPLGRDGRLAFLFPGEGSQYPNMLADLCIHFPEVRECFDRCDRIFAGHARGYGLSDIVFPRPAFSDDQRQWAESRLMRMDSAVEAVLTGNLAMVTLLQRLGLRPDVLVGHSTGEYSAMIAAGILDLDTEERLTSFSRSLNRYYQDSVAHDGVPRAMLLAIGAEREQVAAIAQEAGGEIFLAMDNCPHQAILVGTREAAERALEIVRREGLIYEQLTFDRAYHTQLFAPYADHLHRILADIPIRQPHLPIYSCTTAAAYPTDPSEIRSLIVEHWARPVEFRRTIESLYKQGVRIFVEAGPRGNLSTFVEDILRGQPFCAVPANVQRRSGVAQLNHLVGMLAAHGVNLDLSYLFERRDPQRVDWGATPGTVKRVRSGEKIVLHTGWPLLKLPDDINQRLQRERNGQPSPLAPLPILGEGNQLSDSAPHFQTLGEGQGVRAAPSAMEAYFQTMDQFLSAQEQIMQAYFGGLGDPLPEPGGDEPWWEHSVTVSGNGHDTGAAPVEDTVTWDAQAGDYARPGNGANHGHSDNEPAHETPVSTVGHDRLSDGREEAVVRSITEPVPNSNGALESRAHITRQLLGLVSERTGYPVEMLDPRLDLEGDLGIDSIKRVEILGSYRQQVGNVDGLNLEELTTQRTLEQIIDLLVAGSGEQAPTPDPRGGAQSVRTRSPLPILGEGHGVRAAIPNTNAPNYDFPLLGDVTSWTPGEELITKRTFDITEDLYLRHHTLGPSAGTDDDELPALAVMPLTMSLEILAEAASALVPDRIVVGLRDVLAYRWIAWDDKPQTLRITARYRTRSGSNDHVVVEIRNLTEDAETGESLKSPVIEATVVLSGGYSEPPGSRLPHPEGGQPSRWQAGRLYPDVMFHGPSWQGVTAIDRTGTQGIVATLRTLPVDGFFRSMSDPHFVLDPVVLDAAGQVIGFWTMEHLASGKVIFPFRVAALDLYGPSRAAGEDLTCVAAIELLGDQLVRSDIDVMTTDGQLWMRLTGWEDKRFELPAGFISLIQASRDVEISSSWPEPIAGIPYRERLQCRRLTATFPSDQGFWKRVWAQRVLSRRERDQFRQLHTPERRQIEWLAARTAAKEAVQQLAKARYGLDLLHSDIEIYPDEHGRPLVGGAWTGALDTVPLISVAHSRGVAVAFASLEDRERCPRVGIDIEYLRPRPAGFDEVAFTISEREVIASLPADSREEWLLRCWCAKEAVAKALGTGLIEGPRSVAVVAVDLAGERVAIRLAGELARRHPDLSTASIVARTVRQGDLIAATTLWETADEWPPVLTD